MRRNKGALLADFKVRFLLLLSSGGAAAERSGVVQVRAVGPGSLPRPPVTAPGDPGSEANQVLPPPLPRDPHTALPAPLSGGEGGTQQKEKLARSCSSAMT